jgi:hypothetical protein
MRPNVGVLKLLSADLLAGCHRALHRGLGDVHIERNAAAQIPPKAGYRLRRGQVATHAGVGQPPRFEASAGILAPPDPALASAGWGVMPGEPS